MKILLTFISTFIIIGLSVNITLALNTSRNYIGKCMNSENVDLTHKVEPAKECLTVDFGHSCGDIVLTIDSQCEDEYKVNYFNGNNSFIVGVLNKATLAKGEIIFDGSIPFAPGIMKRELINTYDPSDVVTITTTVSYNIHYYLKKVVIVLIFVIFFGWIISNTRKSNKIK